MPIIDLDYYAMQNFLYLIIHDIKHDFWRFGSSSFNRISTETRFLWKIITSLPPGLNPYADLSPLTALIPVPTLPPPAATGGAAIPRLPTAPLPHHVTTSPPHSLTTILIPEREAVAATDLIEKRSGCCN